MSTKSWLEPYNFKPSCEHSTNEDQSRIQDHGPKRRMYFEAIYRVDQFQNIAIQFKTVHKVQCGYCQHCVNKYTINRERGRWNKNKSNIKPFKYIPREPCPVPHAFRYTINNGQPVLLMAPTHLNGNSYVSDNLVHTKLSFDHYTF